jgi:twitching motility two-component system response regulator PilH
MPTVVIADDSPTLRRIVTTVLTREGFDVVSAEDGITAVQAVFRTQPDVAVLDVQMPGISGYVATRLLKDDWRTAGIPVIMLTSMDAASDRYWGMQTGADRYLTKDFQPGDLVDSIQETLAAAAVARGGRPPLRAEPVQLTDADVLSRVCDLLDRKLFETSVAAEMTGLAVSTKGLEHSVAGVLGLLGRFAEFDLAGVVLVEEQTAYLALSREVSTDHYRDFVNSAADAAGTAAGVDVHAASLDIKVADPEGRLGGDDDGHMNTFLSMPLRGYGGRVIGVLALSSTTENAFGEAALATLRLVEGPAAVVIDNARLSGARTG